MTVLRKLSKELNADQKLDTSEMTDELAVVDVERLDILHL